MTSTYTYHVQCAIVFKCVYVSVALDRNNDTLFIYYSCISGCMITSKPKSFNKKNLKSVGMTLAKVKEQDGMTLAKVKEQDGMTLAKVKEQDGMTVAK